MTKEKSQISIDSKEYTKLNIQIKYFYKYLELFHKHSNEIKAELPKLYEEIESLSDENYKSLYSIDKLHSDLF